MMLLLIHIKSITWVFIWDSISTTMSYIIYILCIIWMFLPSVALWITLRGLRNITSRYNLNSMIMKQFSPFETNKKHFFYSKSGSARFTLELNWNQTQNWIQQASTVLLNGKEIHFIDKWVWWSWKRVFKVDVSSTRK